MSRGLFILLFLLTVSPIVWAMDEAGNDEADCTECRGNVERCAALFAGSSVVEGLELMPHIEDCVRRGYPITRIPERIFEKLENSRSLRNAIDDYLAEEPDEPFLLFVQGMAWVSDSLDNAKQCWREAIENDADPVSLKLFVATAQVTFGQYDEARELMESVLAEEPESRTALLMLARVYYINSEYDQAIDLYRRVLNQKKDDPEAVIRLAIVLTAADKVDESREVYDEIALTDIPGSLRGLYRFGQAFNHMARGELEPCVNAFFESVNLGLPIYERYVALLNAGGIATMVGQPEYALPLLNVAVSMQEAMPGWPAALRAQSYDLLANAYAQTNPPSPEKYLPLFEKKLALTPEDLNARMPLIQHYLDTEQLEKAMELIEEALPDNQEDPGLLLAKGWAHLKMGDTAAAVMAAHEALACPDATEGIRASAALLLARSAE